MMSEFDFNASYEFLAERFYQETNYMAPGKSVAPEMAYSEDDDKKRRKLWDDYMTARNREAWTLWHGRYGYLRSAVEECDDESY